MNSGSNPKNYHPLTTLAPPFCLRLVTVLALLGWRLVVTGSAASCFPPPTGLVGWWAGGGNANDVAATNNGVLLGGASANNLGMVGSAFTFDGTNSYVQIPDTAAFHPTNLTLE